MSKTGKLIVLSVMALLTTRAFAGGFWMELGNPGANAEAKAKGAVLIARVTGCHDPAKATVTATAEGIVNGKRQSVTLKPVALSTPGMYAFTREWPAEGKWVVKLVGIDNDRTTSAVARMDSNGFDRASAKYFPRLPTASEVEAVLAGKAGEKAVKTAAL